jgi:hypothetical protein
MIQSSAIALLQERSSSAQRGSANWKRSYAMPANVMLINALFVVLVALAAASRWGAGR